MNGFVFTSLTHLNSLNEHVYKIYDEGVFLYVESFERISTEILIKISPTIRIVFFKGQ